MQPIRLVTFRIPSLIIEAGFEMLSCLAWLSAMQLIGILAGISRILRTFKEKLYCRGVTQIVKSSLLWPSPWVVVAGSNPRRFCFASTSDDSLRDIWEDSCVPHKANLLCCLGQSWSRSHYLLRIIHYQDGRMTFIILRGIWMHFQRRHFFIEKESYAQWKTKYKSWVFLSISHHLAYRNDRSVFIGMFSNQGKVYQMIMVNAWSSSSGQSSQHTEKLCWTNWPQIIIKIKRNDQKGCPCLSQPDIGPLS